MKRTPDQVAADEKLRAAVDEHRRFWHSQQGAEESVLTEFVVVGALMRFDDDGVPAFDVFTEHTEDAMPAYRIAGLLGDAIDNVKRQARE